MHANWVSPNNFGCFRAETLRLQDKRGIVEDRNDVLAIIFAIRDKPCKEMGKDGDTQIFNRNEILSVFFLLVDFNLSLHLALESWDINRLLSFTRQSVGLM